MSVCTLQTPWTCSKNYLHSADSFVFSIRAHDDPIFLRPSRNLSKMQTTRRARQNKMENKSEVRRAPGVDLLDWLWCTLFLAGISSIRSIKHDRHRFAAAKEIFHRRLSEVERSANPHYLRISSVSPTTTHAFVYTLFYSSTGPSKLGYNSHNNTLSTLTTCISTKCFK